MRENVKTTASVLSVLLLALIAAGQWWLSQPPGPHPKPQPAPTVTPIPTPPGPHPVTPPEPQPTPPGPPAALVWVKDSTGKRISDEALERAIATVAANVGQWTAEAVPEKGQPGWSHIVTVSEAAPVVPHPVPPGPSPQPPVVPPVVVTPPPVTPPAPVKAAAVTYVYEKDDNSVPVQVKAAFNILNRQGINANEFEQNTKDGAGQVPAQYQVPLQAALQAGLPALVVTAGQTVLKVVKDPRTAEQVLEAVK